MIHVDEDRKKIIFSLIFISVVIVFMVATGAMLLGSVFTGLSIWAVYVLTAMLSFGLGYLMFYLIGDTHNINHVVETGLLIPFPVVLKNMIMIGVVQKLSENLAKIATTRPGLGGSGLINIFSGNVPDAIAMGAVVYIFFNIPLAYLLFKRRENTELFWYVAIPFLIAIIYFVAQIFISMFVPRVIL